MAQYISDPTAVDLTTADPRDIVCFLEYASNDYDGRLGARISALFVILIASSAATFFPVVAARVKWVRINIYVYLFARYFGAGVILATAFIQYGMPFSLLTPPPILVEEQR
jgi:zinc transporter 1/2/3